VAASADDAEESEEGEVSLDSSDLELTDDHGTQTIGVRFRKLALPHGARILRAWVRFTVDDTSAGPTPLGIAGENVDDSAVFGTGEQNISRRPRTPGVVAWNPAAWPTAGASGKAQETPDLTAVIQQIVDRLGWASGHALTLLVTGTGDRVAVSFDGDSSSAPLLHVDYLPVDIAGP
jgi:hypothetical protein